VIDDNNNDR